MSKDFRMKLEKVFDFLGEILAFVIAVFWGFTLLNTTFNWISQDNPVIHFFLISKELLLLILVGVVGLEATIKRNIIIRLFFYLLLAILIIFHFFPTTYQQIIGTLPR